MGTIAKIGGRTILGSFTWTLSSGTSPYQAVARVTESDASALLTGTVHPVTLEMSVTINGEKNTDTFKNLYVLGEVPPDSPVDGILILISDRRWLWPSYHFKRSYNVTRRVGTKSLIAPNQVSENVQLAPTVEYAPWSMYNSTKAWTAKTVVESLAEAIKAVEKEYSKSEAGVRTSNIFGGDIGAAMSIPVQDLELDGPLDECIDRALSYIPGKAIMVDQDGVVVFYDVTTADELSEVNSPEIVGQGHVKKISYARTRPSRVRVLFTINSELRFDFDESASSTSDDPDARTMDNVAPVQDPTVMLSGKTYTTGTWLKLTDLYQAWGSMNGSLHVPMTTSFVRGAMVPYNEMWGSALLCGETDPNSDWAARVSTVMTHFRQTFRISRRWIDAITELRANRVGTLDPVTGTLGKAPVYSDYSYLHTMRSLYLEANGGRGSYCVNVVGYPHGGVIEDTTRAAAATLSVIDSEQGILSIDYLADRMRVYEQAMPSQVEVDGNGTEPGRLATQPGPTPDLGFSTNAIGFDVIGPNHRRATLTADHKVAVIVSCVPSTPNDKAGLLAVDIYPNDKGVASFDGMKDCRGPIYEVRIPPSMTCALIAWTDEKGPRIQNLFMRKVGVEPLNVNDKDIQDLILNLGEVGQAGASIKSIATAAASSLWTSYRDRLSGSMSTAYSPGLIPNGNLSSISHSIDQSTGAITTSVSLPIRISPLNIMRYVSASVKRFIYKIASFNK